MAPGSHRGEFAKLDKMQLRPGFTGAVTVASSIITLCGPASGGIVAPLVLIGCDIAFVAGYSNLDRVICQNAATDAETDGWASDADQTFATALTGTIFSVVDTPVYLYAASTGRIIFGLCFVSRRTNLDIETEV